MAMPMKKKLQRLRDDMGFATTAGLILECVVAVILLTHAELGLLADLAAFCTQLDNCTNFIPKIKQSITRPCNR